MENTKMRRKKYAVLSGTYKYFDSVRNFGIEPVAAADNPSLPHPVCSHADMNFYLAPDGALFASAEQGEAAKRLHAAGYDVRYISESLGGKYPSDVRLNCANFGQSVMLNRAAVSRDILAHIENTACKIIETRQGYAKCSVFSVNERAAITADDGVYNALCSEGIDVLKIRAGYIEIEQYDYGFIGGAGGMIDENTALFFGDIKTHPDYDGIKSFLSGYGVSIECLGGALTDIGGIIML